MGRVEVNGAVIHFWKAESAQVIGGAASAVVRVVQLEPSVCAHVCRNKGQDGGDVGVSEGRSLAVVRVIAFPGQRPSRRR